MKTIKNRWNAKTPTALPAALITASGYLVAVGGVTAALSQLTVEDKKDTED
jgi:hypothetical protein